MDIVGKIELISESETLLSMGNIIAIIVAVISLTGVIISTVWTNRTTKKINKDNAELQEKWNQKNIMHLIFANNLIAVLLSFVMLGAKCDDSLINLCPLFVLL